ncbi:hypothetical protein ACFVUS_31385 [Nocardia sp. NPDC058058]|uniref:hypothetical protein n=1 Tax=Nocardia sp. NPDC058058 TaxID=3346317 RepID=UPI0036DB8CDF
MKSANAGLRDGHRRGFARGMPKPARYASVVSGYRSLEPMMWIWVVCAALVAASIAAPRIAVAEVPVLPLPRAHAHNDYLHGRPLYDAVEQGFTSVEADVYPALGSSDLPVAHAPWEIRLDRTLRTLYLDPLRRLVAENGGTVLPGYHGEFQLLIEIKFDAPDVYRVLDATLRDPAYDGLFTRYTDGRVERGPVTVSVLTAFTSGTEMRATMAAQTTRSAFAVGAPEDLGTGLPATLMPEVEADWTRLFSWGGVGPMPEGQRRALQDLVDRAHGEGKRVRFWGAPDEPGPARKALWDEEFDAGVDRLSTDHLSELADYLRSRQ